MPNLKDLRVDGVVYDLRDAVTIKDVITGEYDPENGTYALDATCIYNMKMYKCIVAIDTPEPWTPSHWALDTVMGEIQNSAYVLPLASPTTRGGVKTGFSTDSANRLYAVQLNDEKMFVNIPWTDTTYGDFGGATSSTDGTNGLVPAPLIEDKEKFLKGDGTWREIEATDTKNTAGSTNSTSKLYLIGATSQGANPVTHSRSSAYVGTDGCLYSGGEKVLTAHQDISMKANDNEVVHIAGNETIEGTKTFRSALVINKDDSPSAGSVVNAFQLNYKNSSGANLYTVYPIRYIGNDESSSNNAGIMLGSNSGTTIISAGENATNFPSRTGNYNDENIYLVSDGVIKMCPGIASDGAVAGIYEFGTLPTGITANVKNGITSIERNGTTFTATRLDGTTFTFTQKDDDTKNTAGATDSSNKLFIIGALSQGANPQTFSQDTAYIGTDGCLYSGGAKVITAHQDISGKKNVQSAVADPAADGTGVTFIDSLSQDTQGVISPHKRTVRTMGGATSNANGSTGLVPAPTSSQRTYFLRGDATWQALATCDTTNVRNALSINTSSGSTAKFLTEKGTWTAPDLSGKKNVQSAVSDPAASGTSITFISSISQNVQGVISPSKATVKTMGGASSSSNGATGLVPAPTSAQRAYFLRGDATWQNIVQCDATNVKSALGISSNNSASNFLTAKGTWVTLESKSATNGSSAISLVTAGEKYTWNNKANTSDLYKINLNGTNRTLVIKTGACSCSHNNTTQVYFATAFPSTCTAVVLYPTQEKFGATTTCVPDNISKTGFRAFQYNSANVTLNMSYVAFGY